MKKILALLLSAIMVAVIFTGCGSDLEKYAGTYVGKEGTILILNKDGTAFMMIWSAFLPPAPYTMNQPINLPLI